MGNYPREHVDEAMSGMEEGGKSPGAELFVAEVLAEQDARPWSMVPQGEMTLPVSEALDVNMSAKEEACPGTMEYQREKAQGVNAYGGETFKVEAARYAECSGDRVY